MAPVEKVAGRFLKDRGSKRAKDFAVLDPAIQDFLHLGTARIGEDAAIPQCARSPFHRALIPAHDFSGGNVARYGFDERCFIQLGDADVLQAVAGRIHGIAELPLRVGRAPVGVVHSEFARSAEDLVMNGESRADRQASITRRGLNVHPLKGRAAENFAIREAIEGYAARKAEGRLPGFSRQGDPMRFKDFLERSLHAGGQIAMPLRERFFGFSSGPEALFEVGRKKATEYGSSTGIAPRHFRPFALMTEILETEAEGKRRVRPDDFPEFAEKFRLAIGREAHDFVFVAELPKSKVLREGGVVHAERMRERDFAKDVHLRAFARGPHGAGEITQTIHRKNGCAFMRGNKKGARKVRGVVLDALNARTNRERVGIERGSQVFSYSGETLQHANALDRKA